MPGFGGMGGNGMGAGGSVGELVGGIFGDFLGQRSRQSSRNAILHSLRDIEEVNPEVVERDPRVREAQLWALRRMQAEGDANGMGVEDRAAMADAQDETARRERGSREAILQDMARRGQSGGGTELAAALTNQQGSADRQAEVGRQAAADARKRALAAISEGSSIAGDVRGEDDAVAQFNASQRLRRAGMLSAVRSGVVAPMYDRASDRWIQRGAGVGRAVGTAIGSMYGAG